MKLALSAFACFALSGIFFAQSGLCERTPCGPDALPHIDWLNVLLSFSFAVAGLMLASIAVRSA